MAVTCGSDKTLRLWEIDRRTQLKCEKYDHELCCVDWSPNGKFIVVGDRRGVIMTLDDKLTTLDTKPTKFRSMKTQRTNQTYSVSEVRFSPDNKKIALGGRGGPSHVEVWEIDGTGKLLDKGIQINVGFTNSLTHLDWSVDSLYMMATSEGYELKFISCFKSRDVSVNQVKDVHWATMSCVYGYNVQGICNDSSLIFPKIRIQGATISHLSGDLVVKNS